LLRRVPKRQERRQSAVTLGQRAHELRPIDPESCLLGDRGPTILVQAFLEGVHFPLTAQGRVNLFV
jgi:hypothetical protein